MESILVTARYTIVKYLRNPLAVIAFIVAPLLLICVLTGSIDNNLSKGFTDSQIEQSKINLQNNIINPNEAAVSKNDKVAMASILIFLFYGAILSSNLVINDLKNGINTRLKSLPITRIKILLGKSIGCIGIMGIFAFALVIITTYFFNTNWGENKLVILVAIALFLVIENSFGIIVSCLSKNIYVCVLPVFAINFFMVFPVYVEAYSPIKISGALEIISKLSFDNYVVKAITTGSVNSLMVLFISAAIMFCVSLFVGKKVLN